MILTGRDTYAGSIARSAVASFLGRISYSLYLVHWIFGSLAHHCLLQLLQVRAAWLFR